MVDVHFNKVIEYDYEKSRDDVELEVELQIVSSKYGFTPKIIDVIYETDKATIIMENLNEMCLADKYGEDSSDIPEHIWNKIRDILLTLLNYESIQYTDVTPYNFIEKDSEVYIIDFGDANYIYENQKVDEYLERFFNGENEWNEDFA